MSDDKTALQQKKSENSAAARGSGFLPAPQLPDKVRRAGKSPIVVPKGKSLTKTLTLVARAQEALREQGMADQGTARSLVDHAAPDPAGGDLLPPRVAGRPTGASAPNAIGVIHREMFLPKKSREIPPNPAERCPVCFGLLPYHQKGCKNA